MELRRLMQPILSTYRLQLHGGFRLDAARRLVDYLHRLGVTHLYSSPLSAARPDSTHGYDVVDPTALNPALGDEEDLASLVRELRRQAMGLVLDIVPNHMAVDRANWRWEDVLRHGAASPFARWFDIDWRSPEPEMWGRVLLPVLGDRRRKVVERRELKPELLDGDLRLTYFEHSFPMDPFSLPRLLLPAIQSLERRVRRVNRDVADLRRVIGTLRMLPGRNSRKAVKRELRLRESAEALGLLASLCARSAIVREYIQVAARQFADGPGGTERMLRLLDAQPYRLSYWRRAAGQINYRRFFDINELMALHMEDPQVFGEANSMTLRWVEAGWVDGLRVDHIDGLLDPFGYLQRLFDAAQTSRPDETERFPIFVEKILARDERLRREWPVAGTTGYEFLNEVESAFLDPGGAAALERHYRRFARRPAGFEEAARAGKRRILRDALSAPLTRLAQKLAHLAERDRKLAQTPPALSEAIAETIACLPVYRTYVDGRSEEIASRDTELIEEASAWARERAVASPAALALVEQALRLEGQAEREEHDRLERLRFVQRFQQLSGPATAKGVEDTAFYTHMPLLSRNEVGGSPGEGLDDAVDVLHMRNADRAKHWPHTMTCTSTHDTKTSADVRSRLDVLTEVHESWASKMLDWSRWNDKLKTTVHGRGVPDPNTEYLVYQTLAGVWPLPSDPAAPPPEDLEERVVAFMRKAVREAKLYTSWTDPDAAWEAALDTFVRALFTDAVAGAFRDDLSTMVRWIGRPGLWNALSRCLVHLCSPGNPDLYQGDELWNFSLVDPDNRRPVDFELRERLLAEIEARFDAGAPHRGQLLDEMLSRPEDGRIKLHLIHSVLHVRRQQPELFRGGSYERLQAEGPKSRHVLAFLRCHEDRGALVIAPRLTVSLLADPGAAPIGPDVWGDTHVTLPPELGGLGWHSPLTGATVRASRSSQLRVAEALEQFPVALLLA